VLLGHLVKELDDVGEVHVPVEDDVAVVLDEGEGDEEKEVAGDNEARGPNRLPDQVDITIGKLTLEVQKKPPKKYKKYFSTQHLKILPDAAIQFRFLIGNKKLAALSHSVAMGPLVCGYLKI